MDVVAANERMTTWLRGHQTMKYVGTDDYVPVQLFDLPPALGEPPGRLGRGDIRLARSYSRRFDIVLWVNGLPLVVGETKTPVDKHKSWLNGASDIHDIYEVEAPSFFATNVLSFATEGREFHYGAVGQPAEHWLMWGATTDPWDLSRRRASHALGRVAALPRPGALDSAELRPLRPAEDRRPRHPRRS